MSTKKAAKKAAVKKTTDKVVAKRQAKKSATDVTNDVVKSSRQSKKTVTKKVATKKGQAAPENVIPMPGKLSRFVDKHREDAKELGMKAIKTYGPDAARFALKQGAKHIKHPLIKKSLGWLSDHFPKP